MRTEILINYNEAEIETFHNALHEDCISFKDGDTTIKLLDVPRELILAINTAEDR